MDASLRRGLAATTLGLALALGLSFAASSCLPGDVRPPPAVVPVSVEPSAALLEGLHTEDGWDIHFERVLIALGGTSINGSECNSYAPARYDRLFDATRAGQQKLSELYGLGSCGFRVRLRVPSSTALLGEGVRAEDLDLMRDLDGDQVVSLGGTSLYVQGTAVKGETTRRFGWHFRRGISFHNCGAADGGVFPDAGSSDAGDTARVTLVGGATVPLVLQIRADELFRTGPGEDAPHGFDTIASASAEETIALDDLDTLPSPPGFAPDAEDGGDAGPPSLEDFLYGPLLGRVIQLEGKGLCQADPRATNL